MNKSIETRYLFEPKGIEPVTTAGWHNVEQLLRAADPKINAQATARFNQRCGHIPLQGNNATVLVSEHRPSDTEQFQYLSDVFGKTVRPSSFEEFSRELFKENKKGLVVPYMNLPEAKSRLTENGIDARLWGLPAGIVDRLKNKAEFHERVAKADIKGLQVPDFRIITTQDFVNGSRDFLREIDDLYNEHNMNGYKRGIIVRPAESEGNYGAFIVREKDGYMEFLPGGDKSKAQKCGDWDRALRAATEYVRGTTVSEIENRLVVSRLIDLEDSPGISFAVLDGVVLPLGWNGQLQEEGTTACIGTETYIPKEGAFSKNRDEFADVTTDGFKMLLKGLAEEQGVDFEKINGFANLDVMVPGPREVALQIKRFGSSFHYIAESNPRFTNFTDGVLTGVAARRLPQTVESMKTVIGGGIQNVDKFKLPDNLDPREVRDAIYSHDARGGNHRTRIITRQTFNPMGVIFMGNTQRAERELMGIVQELAKKSKYV